MNRVPTNVSFTAFRLKVSNSLIGSLAVLSNTIIASAKIATLVRNTVGNCINGWFLYSIAPKNIPVNISSKMSGILSLFPIQEQITPTNSSTAIAVVMISASCMLLSQC